MCEHNTTIVKYDQGNVQVEVCTWGCGQTLIGVKDATGLTHTFTVAELSALRERVKALEAALKKIAKMKNYRLKDGETLHNAYYRCYTIAETTLQAP